MGLDESDGALVTRAQRGDRLAFDELMRRHQQGVFALSYRMLGQYDDAVDLAQEAFLRAYRSLGRFRSEASFKTWLYQIALNLGRNRRRWYARHKVSQTVSLNAPTGAEEDGPALAEIIPGTGPDPREASARGDRRAALQQALAGLPDPLRAIVVLRDIEGLSYEEVAAACGQTIGTVKSRLHRARGQLRERLRGGHYGL